MDLQHLNLKLYLHSPTGVRTGDYTGVFNGWIQQKALDEMLVDVADYGHVPHGPGLVLIGHEANYSLDEIDGRLGLLYNRKARVEGSTQDRLRQALRKVLVAADKLEREQGFKFSGSEVQLIVNDRALAPNTPETLDALAPELDALFTTLYDGAPFTLTRTSTDPRERLTVTVATTLSADVPALLSRLEAETTHASAH